MLTAGGEGTGEERTSRRDVTSTQVSAVPTAFTTAATSTATTSLSLAGSKLRKTLGSTLNESVSAPVCTSAIEQLKKFGWKEGQAIGKRRYDDDHNGLTTHIVVSKRADTQAGLGTEQYKKRQMKEEHSQPTHLTDEWWKGSVAMTLARLSSTVSTNTDTTKKSDTKKKKKDKKDKKDKTDKKQKKKDKDKKKKKTLQVESDNDNDNNQEGQQQKQDDGQLDFKIYTDEELFKVTGGARFGMRAGRTRNLVKWTRAETLSSDCIDENIVSQSSQIIATEKISQQQSIISEKSSLSSSADTSKVEISKAVTPLITITDDKVNNENCSIKSKKKRSTKSEDNLAKKRKKEKHE